MNRRVWMIVLTVIVLVVGISCVIARRQSARVIRGQAASPAHNAGERAHAHEKLVIAGLQTAPVVIAPVTTMLSVTGEVQPDEERIAKVGSPVAGRLVQLPARVGQSVQQGELLAVVASQDIAAMQSALTRARTEEQVARTRLQTVRELAQSGALTQKPLEEAENNQTAALAAVKQADIALARARTARELATEVLARTRKLAEADAYQARPVEDARREVATAQAEMDSALAAVRVRQLAYDRSKRLFDAGIAARQDVEHAEVELEQSTAQVSEARLHLEVAQGALARVVEICGQNLYTSAEIQTAETAVQQAEHEVTSCQAEAQRARSHLSVAESILARERVVARKTILARQEIQTVEAALARARAEVRAAENALQAVRAAGSPLDDNTVSIPITAPISGVITERQVTPGQAVAASMDLLTIVDTTRMWVWANVYEKDLAQVRVGQRADISITSAPGKVFTGEVTYIASGLKADTRTARIRCEVANPHGELKAGMFATVNLATDQQTKAMLIPRQAVLDDAGKKVVFSPCMECPEDIAAGKSMCGAYDRREVTVGPVHGDQVEILSGLQLGIAVVTTGQYQLKTALGSGQLEAGCEH